MRRGGGAPRLWRLQWMARSTASAWKAGLTQRRKDAKGGVQGAGPLRWMTRSTASGWKAGFTMKSVKRGRRRRRSTVQQSRTRKPKHDLAVFSAHERRWRSDPPIGERAMSREAENGTGGGLEGNFTTEPQRPQSTASEGKSTVTVPPLPALPWLATEERLSPHRDRVEGLQAGLSFAADTTTGEAPKTVTPPLQFSVASAAPW